VRGREPLAAGRDDVEQAPALVAALAAREDDERALAVDGERLLDDEAGVVEGEGVRAGVRARRDADAEREAGAAEAKERAGAAVDLLEVGAEAAARGAAEQLADLDERALAGAVVADEHGEAVERERHVGEGTHALDVKLGDAVAVHGVPRR